MDKLHPSHKTRGSDASSFDAICTECGATDISGGGWGALAQPCQKAESNFLLHATPNDACEPIKIRQ